MNGVSSESVCCWLLCMDYATKKHQKLIVISNFATPHFLMVASAIITSYYLLPAKGIPNYFLIRSIILNFCWKILECCWEFFYFRKWVVNLEFLLLMYRTLQGSQSWKYYNVHLDLGLVVWYFRKLRFILQHWFDIIIGHHFTFLT